MMRKGIQIPYVMSIYELIELYKNGWVASEEEDYLRKGERILTLLREKARKRYSQINTDSEFLNFFNFDALMRKCGRERWDYAAHIMGQRIVEAAMKNCMNDEGDHIEDIKPLRTLLSDYGVTILNHDISISNDLEKILQALFPKKRPNQLVSLQIERLTCYLPFPCDVRIPPRYVGCNCTINGNSENNSIFINASRLFGSIALKHAIIRHIDALHAMIPPEKRGDNVIFHYLEMQSDACLRLYAEGGNVGAAPELCNKEWFRTYLETEGLSPLETIDGLTESDALAIRLMAGYGELPEIKIKQMENCSFVVEKEPHMMLELLILLLCEREKDKEEEASIKELLKHHARSCENLRGISGCRLTAMKHSGFNQYFGYVEFDDDCLLTGQGELAFDILDENGRRFQTEELIHEFAAIANLFGWEKREEVSLRFRKLGNHRAAGLYYPLYKCLCVDIHFPSSMIHEYFHMLDHEGGNVSRGVRFQSVYQEYERAFLAASTASDDAVKKKLQGRSKYNAKYYLQPTEAFARCAEMYLIRSLGIQNALLKDVTSLSFAYPDDAVLQSRIEEYFDTFLAFDRTGFLERFQLHESRKAV